MTPRFPLLLLVSVASACSAVSLGGCSSPPPKVPGRPLPETVFDKVAPSVVAIMNDDKAERDRQTKVIEAALGHETRAPKHVIDVSLRKDAQPEGTGFLLADGTIVTAAHVVERPDLLKIITRTGQIEEADLVSIDEVRDIAILKPKKKLEGVVPIALDPRPPHVGQPVWSIGHTGQGWWQLSWGMSEGIASGVIDAFGAKLLLFDANIYPGFSGGPVVALGDDGVPRVVGVNHASLFPFSRVPIYSLPSAIAASEVQAVVDHKPPPIEPALSDYARSQRSRTYADLFVTNGLSVGRDASGRQTATIRGNARDLEATTDSASEIPVVAMLFGLGKGSHDLSFEALDPEGKSMAKGDGHVDVRGGERVNFASSQLFFIPRASGRYSVVVREKAKKAGDLDVELGRTHVALELDDDDDSLIEDTDADSSDDGQPDVDVVVAQEGNDDPLRIEGIRADWAELTYPRRVSYSWFARGSRGWAGTNVSVAAFVLDDSGHIVGRADGCYHGELRPEVSWSCSGTSGMVPPLPRATGRYDIVFALNDRPVAWWPMEATLRTDTTPDTEAIRWRKDLARVLERKSRALSHPFGRLGIDGAPVPPPVKPGKGGKKPKNPSVHPKEELQ